MYKRQPDIFTFAKGVASGMPMGGCVARIEVAEAFEPGDHGSTFGGSNLAAAAAYATPVSYTHLVHRRSSFSLMWTASTKTSMIRIRSFRACPFKKHVTCSQKGA